MAPTIRLLDETLIDQIAAGEVIERPANLVKELLENAVDAEATQIAVSVQDGGRAQVRVQDDGIGMSAEDLRLSVQRHATSKITSFEDLLRVATLGFRGEALPSIGSVSKMTILTRAKGGSEGTRLVMEGGVVRHVEPAGCPPGTTVEVADLFFNVPARRKFLRARQTETSKIFEVCQRMALSHPALRLVVASDGRVARRYLPAKSLGERARQIFGGVSLLEIHVERDGLMLEAALAPVEAARPGARQLFLLVNGRPIVDRALARAIAFAYGDQLPRGHYPRGVVSLRLPPDTIDVNAHPQKTEVRFRAGAVLMDRVSRALAARLGTPSSGRGYWESRIGGVGPTLAPAAASPAAPSVSRAAEGSAEYESLGPGGLRFVAQVGDRAIICENGREALVLDRASADALVRYDRLRTAADSGSIPPETLLFPDRIELAPSDERTLEQHRSLLRVLGLEWSALGEGTTVIRALPRVVADAPAAILVKKVLQTLRGNHADRRDAALRALAEGAAVPNGTPVDDETARRLVAKIDPDQQAHRSCVLGRVPLPPVSPGTNDG